VSVESAATRNPPSPSSSAIGSSPAGLIALRAYAAMALSADKGAVRDVTRLEA
jgi:hypothetical protein